jgi:disulfide bond formation protein DsbB
VTRTDAIALALIATAGGLIGGALFLEHVLDLEPCPLCLMQRLWVGLVGVIACIAIVHGRHHLRYAIAAGIAAIVGAGFALRQIYLQHLPADQVPACGPGFEYMLDVFPASEVLKAMVLGTGNCAEVTWTFLGISIAGWSLAAFVWMLALAAVQIWTVARAR